MPRLYVPIGIPGSGKSTWAKALLPVQIVSTDVIRQAPSLFPDGYVYSKGSNGLVFDKFHEYLANWLREGHDVVADATNLQARHRRELLFIADRADADVHYIVFTNVGQAVLRNARREGWARVPDEAMLRFVLQYEEALKEILIEPYETITFIERTL